MTKRTTNRVPLLGALAALLLAVAFWFLLYTPRNADLELVRQEVAQLETQRSSLQGEVARLRDVEINQVRYRSDLARLEELIPSGTAQSTAVRQFQLVADAAGIEIDAVSFASPILVPDAPSTGVPETALARIPVTMSLSGGYFQVVDFFRRLEVETPRALLIGNLSATEDEEDKFPALGSTWTGDLFAVVPIASIPPEVPLEPPAEGEPEADAPIESAAEEGATS